MIMGIKLEKSEFTLFRDFIEKHCGICIPPDKAYLIETRLNPIVKELNCKSFGQLYLKLMVEKASGKLFTRFVDAITTHETLWMRDQHPFKVLKEKLLPEFREEIQIGKRRGINIWSAACSTGQEPYSIAMTSLDFYRSLGAESVCFNELKILATDISSACLAYAETGEYDSYSMERGLPPDELEQYFTKHNGSWKLDDKVRKMVTFKQHNLQDPFHGEGLFDIIFLRNVIIYMSNDFKQEVLNRVPKLLCPGGYMFLGTGETISGYTTAFDLLEHNGALFYKRKAN